MNKNYTSDDIDQVVNYIERYLGAYSINKEDKVITKTMINNYVKQGKLHPQKHLGGVNEFKKSELDQLLKKK